jgi:hypothetical protein
MIFDYLIGVNRSDVDIHVREEGPGCA